VWGGDTRTIGSGGQLTTGGKAVGHETFEEDGLEIGPGQIDRGGVSCWSRADDDLGKNDQKLRVEDLGGKAYDSGVHLRAPLVYSGYWGHPMIRFQR
jgi:hypothetical protein